MHGNSHSTQRSSSQDPIQDLGVPLPLEQTHSSNLKIYANTLKMLKSMCSTEVMYTIEVYNEDNNITYGFSII